MGAAFVGVLASRSAIWAASWPAAVLGNWWTASAKPLEFPSKKIPISASICPAAIVRMLGPTISRCSDGDFGIGSTSHDISSDWNTFVLAARCGGE
jgi:hypothetical protein